MFPPWQPQPWSSLVYPFALFGDGHTRRYWTPGVFPTYFINETVLGPPDGRLYRDFSSLQPLDRHNSVITHAALVEAGEAWSVRPDTDNPATETQWWLETAADTNGEIRFFRWIIKSFQWSADLTLDLFRQTTTEWAIIPVGQLVSRETWLPYAPSAYAGGGMSDEIEEIIREQWRFLKPWVKGIYSVPVENDGDPGLLEMYRQLTETQTLGTLVVPTLRELLLSVGRCLLSRSGRIVGVAVEVAGLRAGNHSDQILEVAAPAQWEYNHYGQVRVRYTLPRDVPPVAFYFTEWQWVRSRLSVHWFHLPTEAADLQIECQHYGGLDFEAWFVHPPLTSSGGDDPCAYFGRAPGD